MLDLTNTPVTLIGASRGLGRTMAQTFHKLGAKVLVVARGRADLEALTRELPGIHTLACDATTADAPEQVFALQQPRILVLCGGAIPPCVPFPEVDWHAFSENWNNDVQMTFHFLQAALKRPLPKGATIATISSGAVRQGSPISGGYAGAKQMQIFMSSYAQKAADRAGLDLRFVSLVPARLMPETAIGAAGLAGYAAYNGTTEAQFLQTMGHGQTTQQVTDALLAIVDDPKLGGSFTVSPEGMAA